jgi:hypothetical protein
MQYAVPRRFPVLLDQRRMSFAGGKKKTHCTLYSQTPHDEKKIQGDEEEIFLLSIECDTTQPTFYRFDRVIANRGN